jgi:hypothetical protein
VVKKLLIIVSAIIFSYFFNADTLYGQILNDSSALSVLKRGIDSIYNFNFADADSSLEELKTRFPGHPVIYLMNGLITYWENYPMIPSSPSHNSYENDMYSCIRLCEEKKDTADYAEFLITNLGARGMLLTYYADNNFSDNVFPLASGTYRYVRESFDYTSAYPDFYFFTGLYNYYREAYPDAHPVYRLLAFLFPRGDREIGIQEMGISSQKSIILKAESFFFLAHIYLNFENNYHQAYIYSKSLHELYPGNLCYLSYYLRNLLLIKKYQEAEKVIKFYEAKISNSFFRAQLSIFYGILQEKYYRNYELAMKYYNDGIKRLSVFGYYGDEYASYGYFGLSRISEINYDRSGRREYRKKAIDRTSYKEVNFDD